MAHGGREKQATRGPLNHLTSEAICQLEGGDVEHLESARERPCTAVAWPSQKRRPCASPRPPVGCFGPSSNRVRLRNWTPPCWRDQNNRGAFGCLRRSLGKWQQLSNGFSSAGCQGSGLSPGVGVSAAFICWGFNGETIRLSDQMKATRSGTDNISGYETRDHLDKQVP